MVYDNFDIVSGAGTPLEELRIDDAQFPQRLAHWYIHVFEGIFNQVSLIQQGDTHLQQKKNENINLKKELNSAKEKVQLIEQSNSGLAQQIRESDADTDQQNRDMAEVTTENGKLRAELEYALKRGDGYKKNYNAARSNNEQLLIDMDEANHKIAELMQEIEVLKSRPTATDEGPATKMPSRNRASDSEDFSDGGGGQHPTQPRRTCAPLANASATAPAIPSDNPFLRNHVPQVPPPGPTTDFGFAAQTAPSQPAPQDPYTTPFPMHQYAPMQGFPIQGFSKMRIRQEEPKAFKGPDNEGDPIDSIAYHKWRKDMTYYMTTCYWQFPTEMSKLAFIARKLEGEAYRAVAYGFMDGYSTWSTAEEAWRGLETAFGLKNASAQGHAYISDIVGTQMKGGEALGQFLSKFNTALSIIQLDDNARCFHLYQRLPPNYRNALAGRDMSNWSTYLQAVYAVDRDLSLNLRARLNKGSNGNKDNKEDAQATSNNNNSNSNTVGGHGGGSGGGRGRGGGRGGHGGGRLRGNNGNTRPPPCGRTQRAIDTLLGLNRCWNCLETGHRFNADNAPCRDQQPRAFANVPELRALQDLDRERPVTNAGFAAQQGNE